MRADSAASGSAHCIWRAGRAHRSAHADDTAGHQGPPGCRWGRYTRISGIGGRGLSETKHVHVIGIGGSAMAPLAGMLREHGFRVTGADSWVLTPASTPPEKPGTFFFKTVLPAPPPPPPDPGTVRNKTLRGDTQRGRTVG